MADRSDPCRNVRVAAGPSEKYFDIARNLDIFATTIREVNAFYVDEINPNRLIKSGIDAMLNTLDPYTNYIPEDEIENYRTMTTGLYGGIGPWWVAEKIGTSYSCPIMDFQPIKPV
jgi:C-terminal processing protease CtpA/Prc